MFKEQQFLDTKNFVNQYKDALPASVIAPENLDEHQYAQWVMYQSRLPFLEIQGLVLPYSEMYREALDLRDRFVVHRDNSGNGWKSLCIHGTSAEHTDAPSVYGFKNGEEVFDWTGIKDKCPATVRTFKTLFHYKSYMRVRFMWLEPGGFIEPHVDANNFMLGAINISLNNPKNCFLVTEVGTLPYRDSGSAFFLNTSYRHAVWNNSDTPRIHIIVHGTQDQTFWNKIIVDSYKQSKFYIGSTGSRSQELQAV